MPIPYGQSEYPVFHLYYNIQTLPDVYSHLSTLSSLGLKMSVPDGEPEHPVVWRLLQS